MWDKIVTFVRFERHRGKRKIFLSEYCVDLGEDPDNMRDREVGM